jgi:hypothetical protein
VTNLRVICEGHFNLPVPPSEALPLFTPEGERAWAGSAWNPVYPIAAAAEDASAPGTVFTTESDGGLATWVIVERTEATMRYARVAPGRIAGTVTVSCVQPASAVETKVTVTYDVTSLGPEGAAFVEELRDGYDAFLSGWREEIVAALATRARA